MEVYGWLSWATSETTRGLRNRPFDAVLLRRDEGNREVPPGGRVAREDHERVLQAVNRARCQTRRRQGQLSWRGALCSASRTRRPRTAAPRPAHHPHPLVLPPEEPAAAVAPAPAQAEAQVTATTGGNGPAPSKSGPGPQATGTGGSERTNGARHPPGRPGPPDRERLPQSPLSGQREDTRRPTSGRQRGPRTR